jgi:phosphatidylglycerophosphate synthase
MEEYTMSNLRQLFNGLALVNENPALLRLRSQLAVPIARLMIRLHITATILNVFGLLLGLISAILIVDGSFFLALFCLIGSGLCDALDGTVAREMKLVSAFGAFLDSVLDRYVDQAVLIGFAVYFMYREDRSLMILSLIALLGASVTSYAAARAASLGIHRYPGIGGRPQRFLLYLLATAFPEFLIIAIWVLAVIGNITAIHRIVFYLIELKRLKHT